MTTELRDTEYFFFKEEKKSDQRGDSKVYF